MRLVVASNNENKIREIKEILSEHFSEIVGLKDAGITSEPEENGKTFYDNALIKARGAKALLKNTCVLADDSGLEVEALNGEPGILSARYSGGNASAASNNIKLLNKMKGIKNRKANFTCVMVLIKENDEIITSEGKVFGEILTELKGNKGFGYDPLFYSQELKKSFAEASSEEKNKISHRGLALKNLLEKL